MTEPETLYCYPCNMTFRVEAPFFRAGDGVAEHTTCECGRHFWHVSAKVTAQGVIRNVGRVGVWPENVDREEAK